MGGGSIDHCCVARTGGGGLFVHGLSVGTVSTTIGRRLVASLDRDRFNVAGVAGFGRLGNRSACWCSPPSSSSPQAERPFAQNRGRWLAGQGKQNQAPTPRKPGGSVPFRASTPHPFSDAQKSHLGILMSQWTTKSTSKDGNSENTEAQNRPISVLSRRHLQKVPKNNPSSRGHR